MFSLVEVFTGAKDVLQLIPPAIKIIEKLEQQKEDPTLVRILQQIRVDTLEGCQALRAELTQILKDVQSLNLPIDKPLGKVYEDLSWITDPMKKRKVQKLRDRVGEIHQDLTNATDHLASVLACMQKTAGLEDAYRTAETTRKDLDAILYDQPPLRKILETYIKFLDGYIIKLQGK